MAFWIIFDHLGRFIVLNMFTVLLSATLVWLAQKQLFVHPALIVGFACVCFCPLIAGQARLIRELLDGQPFEFTRVVDGIRRFGLSALVLGLLIGVGIGSSGFGILFYGRVFAAEHPLAGMTLAQLCACTSAVFCMVGFYALPALVTQRKGALQAMRMGFLLVFRHPVASTLFLVCTIIYSIFMVTPPGWALLSTLPVTALSCCAYEVLARYHDGNTRERDEEDMYLNRGFRDFLFPWKV